MHGIDQIAIIIINRATRFQRFRERCDAINNAQNRGHERGRSHNKPVARAA